MAAALPMPRLPPVMRMVFMPISGKTSAPLIQQALYLFVPLPAEHLGLALEGFDQAPDDPMGFCRFMAHIGLDPCLPVAARKLLGPVRLHPCRQRILRPDAIDLFGGRADDQAMRLDLIAAIVVAFLDDRFAACLV